MIYFSLLFTIYFSTIFAKNSEEYLPILGLGTAGLGPNEPDVVMNALSLGVRMIDTAQASEWYNERATAEGIQRFLSENPTVLKDEDDKIYIVTKIHPRSFSREKMEEKVHESYEIFKDQGLFAVLLHAPYCWPGQCSYEEEQISWHEAWLNLEELKDLYNIQKIGVSNFDVHLLEELVLNIANHKVSLVQNWMDPFHQDVETRQFCQEHGIQYMAYSSFGTQWRKKNPVLSSPLLNSIARKYNASVAEVVIAWLIEENVIAIPKTSSLAHLQNNFRICQESDICSNGEAVNEFRFKLTPADLDAIRRLDGTLGLPWD